MSKKLDLRCSRRLSVVEGNVILAALKIGAKGGIALSAAEKIGAAIELATHRCRGAKCSICGSNQTQKQRLRERRAADFRERLRACEKSDRARRSEQRRDALINPPPLKLAGGAP